ILSPPSNMTAKLPSSDCASSAVQSAPDRGEHQPESLEQKEESKNQEGWRWVAETNFLGLVPLKVVYCGATSDAVAFLDYPGTYVAITIAAAIGAPARLPTNQADKFC